MHDRDEHELTAAEREALAELPREITPGRLLEERIVAVLRLRGLLGPRRARRPGWIPVGAAAAGLALFAAGIALGQWLGVRQTTGVIPAGQGREAGAVEQVQRAGSAYLTALGALAQAGGESDPSEAARARQAAQSVLREAAHEMVRQAPDDPLSVEILLGFERAGERPGLTKADGKQRLVWF